MKKFLNYFYLSVFAFGLYSGGFYLGSKEEKVEIILPASAAPPFSAEISGSAENLKPKAAEAATEVPEPETAVS